MPRPNRNDLKTWFDATVKSAITAKVDEIATTNGLTKRQAYGVLLRAFVDNLREGRAKEAKP